MILAATLALGLGAAPASRAEAPAAEYSVTAGEGARELRVEAVFRAAAGGALAFEDGAGRHVRDAEIANGRAWSPVGVEDDRIVQRPPVQGVRMRDDRAPPAGGGGPQHRFELSGRPFDPQAARLAGICQRVQVLSFQ